MGFCALEMVLEHELERKYIIFLQGCQLASLFIVLDF